MTSPRRHRPEPVDRDVYRSDRSLPEGTRCPDCGLAVMKGRWMRVGEVELPTARSEVCPACRRVRDGYPAGTIELSGALEEVRDELSGLVRNVEKAESAEHPLERIIDLEVDDEHLVASTTGVHLARRIGRALERRFGERVRLRYGEEENLLRVVGEL